MRVRRFLALGRCVSVAAVAIFVPLSVVATGGTAYAVGRVSADPAAFTMNESGGLQIVQFRLDAPIIAPTPDPTVNLTFTVDDPSRISVSPSTLEWDAAAWSQIRTLTVTAIHDGVHDASNTVTVHVATASASAYYNGFPTSFTATIVDADPAPTTTTTPATTTSTAAPAATATTPPSSAAPATTSAPQLATTGGDDGRPLVAGLLSILVGATLLAASRNRSTRARMGRDSP